MRATWLAAILILCVLTTADGQVLPIKTIFRSCDTNSCQQTIANGSCVAIAQKDGQVVIATAGHLFTEFNSYKYEKCEVLLWGRWRKAQLKLYKFEPQGKIDAAIVELHENKPVRKFSIWTSDPKPGDPVTLAGYARGQWRTQDGKVDEVNSKECFWVDRPSIEGESGGAVIFGDGELLGVISGYDQTTRSRSVVTSSAVLRDMLRLLYPTKAAVPGPPEATVKVIPKVELPISEPASDPEDSPESVVRREIKKQLEELPLKDKLLSVEKNLKEIQEKCDGVSCSIEDLKQSQGKEVIIRKADTPNETPKEPANNSPQKEATDDRKRSWADRLQSLSTVASIALAIAGVGTGAGAAYGGWRLAALVGRAVVTRITSKPKAVESIVPAVTALPTYRPSYAKVFAEHMASEGYNLAHMSKRFDVYLSVLEDLQQGRFTVPGIGNNAIETQTTIAAAIRQYVASEFADYHKSLEGDRSNSEHNAFKAYLTERAINMMSGGGFSIEGIDQGVLRKVADTMRNRVAAIYTELVTS